MSFVVVQDIRVGDLIFWDEDPETCNLVYEQSLPPWELVIVCQSQSDNFQLSDNFFLCTLLSEKRIRTALLVTNEKRRIFRLGNFNDR